MLLISVTALMYSRVTARFQHWSSILNMNKFALKPPRNDEVEEIVEIVAGGQDSKHSDARLVLQIM